MLSRKLTAMGGDPGLISGRSIFGGTLNGIQAGASLTKECWKGNSHQKSFKKSDAWILNILQALHVRLRLRRSVERRQRNMRIRWFLLNGKQSCKTRD